MTQIIESDRIAGVKFAQLQVFGDERGRFISEVFQTFFESGAGSVDLELVTARAAFLLSCGFDLPRPLSAL